MANSGTCLLCHEMEDIEHLFLRCGRVRSIWVAIGLHPSELADVVDIEHLWDANPFQTYDGSNPPQHCTNDRALEHLEMQKQQGLQARKRDKLFQRGSDDLKLRVHRTS